MVAGIHHIKLPVSDVARSRAWYERVLGFETSIEFVEDGVVAGVALRRDGCQPQIALRHDPDRARALSGFDAVALLVEAGTRCTSGALSSTTSANPTADSSPATTADQSSSACMIPTESRSGSTPTDTAATTYPIR